MIEKKIGSLQINHLERTTIKHLIKEIQNKYKIHENIYNELRKKLKLGIAEEHEYEKEGKSLTKLQNHIKGRY